MLFETFQQNILCIIELFSKPCHWRGKLCTNSDETPNEREKVDYRCYSCSNLKSLFNFQKVRPAYEACSVYGLFASKPISCSEG